MSPEQFWSMHPIEFWWEVEYRRPIRMFGTMTEDEVAEIYDQTYGTPASPYLRN